MRVVHVVGHLGVGGDSSAIFNVLLNKKDSSIKFDFITHPGYLEESVKWCKELGSNVYILSGDVREQGLFRYYREIKSVLMKNGPFDAIHMHTSMQSGVGLLAAKKAGIKKRITHSHVTTIQRPASILKRIIAIPIFKFLIKNYATDYVACGDAAGRYLFGRQADFDIVSNGIDSQSYMIRNNSNVNALRSEFSIGNNTIVVGHVGRLCKMKNQEFIIELAKIAKQMDLDVVFILVGEGEDRGLIQNAISKYKLERFIKLVGRRSNIPDFMHLFNVFILPSLLGEGLPVTLIEAQAAGCFCIASDNVSKEADIGLGIMKYNELSNLNLWIKDIQTFWNSPRPSLERLQHAIRYNMLDRDSSTKKWLDLYKK
ncbi:MAG: glycosyltransferase [Bacillota bacterium]